MSARTIKNTKLIGTPSNVPVPTTRMNLVTNPSGAPLVQAKRKPWSIIITPNVAKNGET